MPKVTVKDLPVAGRRVFVRVDFNVPLQNHNGSVTVSDDTRIRGAVPTLQYLREQGAKIILASHLGRPKGEANPKYSLRPAAERLGELLKTEVGFAEDCVGEPARNAVDGLANGQIVLLENLRFHPGEEANDPAFAKQLAELAEVYVNDAFGAAHRAHASTAGVPALIKDRAIGLLMEKELRYLAEELQNPARPFTVILGGAKVSDKIGVIRALLDKADKLLIGGAMAYTFYQARGISTGDSLVEPDKVDLARELLQEAERKGVRFLLPVDNIVAREFKAGADAKPSGPLTPGHGIEAGWQGLDIGPETIERFTEELNDAKTVVWNGPMGVFEIPDFSKGTFAVAQKLAQLDATTIIGGGDSVTAVEQAGLADKMTFISTGGGASLELLEGKKLPGVEAIPDRH